MSPLGRQAGPIDRIDGDLILGLGSSAILAIVPDSRGFLWFGTRDGVSRYDGHRLVSYTTADGLPDGFVTTIIEAKNGAMYIATVAGLAVSRWVFHRALGSYRSASS